MNIETVRYYQRRGLLDQPRKPDTGGFRLYSEEDLVRIRFIKGAQQLGFTLNEIAELIEHVRTGNCTATRSMASRKLLAIESQAAELERVANTLRHLVADCHSGCTENCPIIHRLRTNAW